MSLHNGYAYLKKTALLLLLPGASVLANGGRGCPSIKPATHLLFIAKNMERIGDHATNIAERVHFAVMGEMPGEERPKGDDSHSAVAGPR